VDSRTANCPQLKVQFPWLPHGNRYLSSKGNATLYSSHSLRNIHRENTGAPISAAILVLITLASFIGI